MLRRTFVLLALMFTEYENVSNRFSFADVMPGQAAGK
jgi:hypothetical protein